MINKTIKELKELIELLRHSKSAEQLKNDDLLYDKFYKDCFKEDLAIMTNGMLIKLALSESKLTDFYKGQVAALSLIKDEFERREKALDQPRQDIAGDKDWEELNN